MKTSLACRTTAVALCFVASAVCGAYIFSPLPDAPKAAEIGEILFERTDTPFDGDYVTIPRDEFLRFFSDGQFRNDFACQAHVRSNLFAEVRNVKGKLEHSAGAFATTDGRIFSWTRPREGVLEIEDAKRRMGWLIYPRK